jgi:preprotein translocase subunit SecF
MLILPLIFLLINLAIVFNNYARTGEFVQYGIDFTGGSLISFPNSYELDPGAIEVELVDALGISEISVRKGGGVLSVETREKVPEVQDYMEEKYGKTGSAVTLEVPLAETFRRQAPTVLIAAFVGMGIVVYVVFRSPLPSMAVLVAALLDIFEAMGLMTLVGVKLSLATVAALLMLIGYSVDTNILLTSRLLKRSEEMRHRLLGAMKTGLTMSATTLCALTALYGFSTSDVLDDIALVLVFGLIADLMNTWLFNAGILRGYLSKKFKLLEKRGRRRSG